MNILFSLHIMFIDLSMEFAVSLQSRGQLSKDGGGGHPGWMGKESAFLEGQGKHFGGL